MLDAATSALRSGAFSDGLVWLAGIVALAAVCWGALRWQYRRGREYGEVERRTLQARVDHANEMLGARIDEMIDLRDRLARQSAAIVDMELRIHALSANAPALERRSTDPSALEEVLTGKLWMREVADAEEAMNRRRSTIPIIAVGNLKGGVGKTTTAANLGAFLALADGPNKRVLFLDLDFQGSLSSVLRTIAGVVEPIRMMSLFDLNRTNSERLLAAQQLHAEGLNPGCEFYDADFQIARLEETLRVDWARRTLEGGPDAPGASPDLRFVLRRFLHSAEVQARYDAVIVDMPPRDTPFAINALCAATHLLAPSKADAMSINGVVRFCEYANIWRKRLNPELRLAGVIPTMTPSGQDWRSRFNAPLEEIARAWGGEPAHPELLPHVPERPAIARTAARDFAVLNDMEVRLIFERLAQSLSRQWPQDETLRIAS